MRCLTQASGSLSASPMSSPSASSSPEPQALSGGVPVLSGFGEIAERYDVVLSDIWGVVHNGREHFPQACAALRRFRDKTGTVVLVTNAPRPFPPILEQLNLLGAPRDCFDEVVTSGDCAAAQKALDANIAFAHQNNINGTPMIVRPDGVTNSGWLPTAELRAFLSASQIPSQNPTQSPTMGTGK